MKTLIVSYIPRGERSHTREVLAAFEGAIEGSEVERLDLLADMPDLFTGTIAENISLHEPAITRNDVEYAAQQVYADRYIEQLNFGFNSQKNKHGLLV